MQQQWDPRSLWLGASLTLGLAACTPQHGTAEPGFITLSGAIQESSPVREGTLIAIAELDTNARLIRQRLTTTKDDTGAFEWPVRSWPVLRITGIEPAATSQGEPLELSAYYAPSSAPEQAANVNLLGHLVHRRVRLLLDDMPLTEAIEQAESELLAAFDFIAPAFVPGRLATSLDLLGEDDDDNAYLRIVSEVLARAGTHVESAGDVQGQLEQVAGRIVRDLEEDGQLDAALRAELSEAAAEVNWERVIWGYTGEFSHVRRILDADADGLAYDDDNCPNKANEDQQNADGDGAGDACDPCPGTECSKAQTCLPFDDTDGTGLCRASCAENGGWELQCAPTERCWNDVCLAACEPFGEPCPSDYTCAPLDESYWLCAPLRDRRPPMGGEPCSGVCAPGLTCAADDVCRPYCNDEHPCEQGTCMLHDEWPSGAGSCEDQAPQPGSDG